MTMQNDQPGETHDDPGIQPVRDIRAKISAECAHDPQRLIDYYLKAQEQYRSRLLPRRGNDDGDDDREKSQRVA